eukprot:Pgem_evm1s4809
MAAKKKQQQIHKPKKKIKSNKNVLDDTDMANVEAQCIEKPTQEQLIRDSAQQERIKEFKKCNKDKTRKIAKTKIPPFNESHYWGFNGIYTSKNCNLEDHRCGEILNGHWTPVFGVPSYTRTLLYAQ